MENWSTSWSKTGLPSPEILSPAFFERDTLLVARELLGKIVVVRSRGAWSGGRIIETEAYRGDDPASHSCRGETPRSSVMFGQPGVAYVYFIYGMYEMLNFVTEKRGFPGAVLIRALEPIVGINRMERRSPSAPKKMLASGPGRLTRALGIKMSHNRASLQGPDIFVLSDRYRPSSISESPRVGVSEAQDRYWRFFESNHPMLSRAPQNAQARLHRARRAS